MMERKTKGEVSLFTLFLSLHTADVSDSLIRPDGVPVQAPKRQDKTEEQVQREIQDIMRNITSSVTFLPSIADKCTYSLSTLFV